MKSRLVSIALSLALCGHAAASQETAAAPVVVELFTSQGCSSCPPADALLGELAQREDLIALGWHVSYWDYIGWTDPFATDAFTERQRAYSRSMGERMVYTPQIVVDGKTHAVGSDRAAVARLIAAARTTAKVAIDVSLGDGGGWMIAIGAGPADPSEVLWVRYLPNANSPVKAGENRGLELRNFNIVRAVTVLGEWRGAAETFIVSPDDAAEGDAQHRRIALLQSRRGPILGAVAIPVVQQ